MRFVATINVVIDGDSKLGAAKNLVERLNMAGLGHNWCYASNYEQSIIKAPVLEGHEMSDLTTQDMQKFAPFDVKKG